MVVSGRALVAGALLAFACHRGPQTGETPAQPGEVGEAPEAPRTQPEEASALQELDALLQARWKTSGTVVAPAVSDEGFLRRATLDLIGRIPTPSEREAFLGVPEKQRRAWLVQELLGSAEYADYQSWRLFDLLFTPAVRRHARLTAPAQVWLREQLRAQRAWDEVVAELLTAEGELEYDAETSFMVAHLRTGGIESLAATVSDRFLGVQLSCAQCHDHPFGAWTQEDFWGLAAGFGSARVRGVASEGYNRLILEDLDKLRPVRVGGVTTKDVAIVPAAIFGRAIAGDDPATVRQETAKAVVSSELFAKAAVSRIWVDLIGRGLHEPWNDLGGPGETHDEILELLARELRRSGYDLGQVIRVVVLSQAYGRSAFGPEGSRREAEQVFARATVRPLNARQVFRSVQVATGLDDLPSEGFRLQVGHQRDHLERTYDGVFADGCTRMADARDVDLAQRLALLNDGLVHSGTLARQGTALAEIMRENQDPKERVRSLYVRVLAREPSDIEYERALELIDESDAPAAYEDLMFALLSGAEFHTNH